MHEIILIFISCLVGALIGWSVGKFAAKILIKHRAKNRDIFRRNLVEADCDLVRLILLFAYYEYAKSERIPTITESLKSAEIAFEAIRKGIREGHYSFLQQELEQAHEKRKGQQ